MPNAARSDGYANAMRNSGAARLLLPYRIHRAGSTAQVIADAQTAVGTTGNPVIDVEVTGGLLVVTFADGTTETHPLPAGGSGGVLSAIDGRLPAAPVEMRIAWSLPTITIDAATFGADSATGTTDETVSPDYPQAFRDAGVNSALLLFWAATDLEPALLPLDTGDVGAQGTSLQIAGVDGMYWSTVDPVSRFFAGIPFSILFPGEVIATQPWVTEQIAAGGGGGMFNGVDQTALGMRRRRRKRMRTRLVVWQARPVVPRQRP